MESFKFEFELILDLAYLASSASIFSWSLGRVFARITRSTVVILQNVIMVRLKLYCLETPRPLWDKVTRLGPAPLATLIIKFAAVMAAPLVSGGFTFSKHGLTLALGKFGIDPPLNAKKMANSPACFSFKFNNPTKGRIPSAVLRAIKSGRRAELILMAFVPMNPPTTIPVADPIPNHKMRNVEA